MSNSNKFLESPFRKSVYSRIAALDKFIVPHVYMTKALDGISNCILRSEDAVEPSGILILGNGGTGKTTICKTILKRYPHQEIIENHARIYTVPAFYASVPSPSTIKSLAQNLLENLGDKSASNCSAHILTKRLCVLLGACRTKIILLDEFHHLLAEGKPGDKQSAKICNWIKTLINNTKVMICLVGVPECESLVQGDTQMARRFNRIFRLHSLHCGTQDEPGPLASFLQNMAKTFVSKLELDGFVNFKEHLAVVQVWAATDGNPAFVMQLIKEATAICLLANRKTVVLSDFAEAYDSELSCPFSHTKQNPFQMTQVQLSLALKSKKSIRKE
jgi:hypothetical protein